nr:YncE [Bacillus subtilis]
MNRGVSFQIPNEYGNFLWRILQPVEIANYRCQTSGESYFVVEGELDDEELFHDYEIVEGAVFEQQLKTNQYYTIFVELKAFPYGKMVNQVNTYEEFADSDCELVLLIADNSYVSIYCKNKNIIEKLYFNALQHDFEDVQFITDENDTRTSLTV